MRACLVLATVLIGLTGFVDGAIGAETFSDCSVCPVMVKVPAGKFLMGTASPTSDSKTDEFDGGDERPQHTVTFQTSFALGQYPVTRGEFAAFVRETGNDPGGCFLPRSGGDVPRVVLSQGLSWKNPGFPQTDRDPVVCISFNDATQYVQWLSKKSGKAYRLPSEAEWEYAARAGTTTAYWWGQSVGSRQANCRECNSGAGSQTQPVGSYPPNPFGLYDTSGNAAEWVEDCWNDNYRGAPKDGSAWTTGQCRLRVLRGGAYDSAAKYVRSAARFRYDSDVRYSANGFRVFREMP